MGFRNNLRDKALDTAHPFMNGVLGHLTQRARQRSPTPG